MLLGVAVADLRVSVQGLEATKEQLEADRYTAQTSLDKVEQEYHQVLFYLSLRLSLSCSSSSSSSSSSCCNTTTTTTTTTTNNNTTNNNNIMKKQ